MSELIVYSESVLLDIGLMTHSEIFMKPSLRKYRALKLYDAQRDVEGEIWVKLVIRIFNGAPEERIFTWRQRLLPTKI